MVKTWLFITLHRNGALRAVKKDGGRANVDHHVMALTIDAHFFHLQVHSFKQSYINQFNSSGSLFDNIYSVISIHAIRMLFHYLNRVGSRIARPHRPNCEIASSDSLPSPLSLEVVSRVHIIRGARYTVLVPNIVLEAHELLTWRTREALVRTLF
jgi:hypothetical protein